MNVRQVYDWRKNNTIWDEIVLIFALLHSKAVDSKGNSMSWEDQKGNEIDAR